MRPSTRRYLPLRRGDRIFFPREDSQKTHRRLPPRLRRIKWRYLVTSSRLLPVAVCLGLAACASAATIGTRSSYDTMDTNDPGRPLDLAMGLQRDPALAAVVSDISATRIRETDSMLVTFGTRHTMADTMSTTRGIGAARLSDQLDDLWAGVRAIGADGHRSLTVAVPPPTFVTR